MYGIIVQSYIAGSVILIIVKFITNQLLIFVSTVATESWLLQREQNLGPPSTQTI